MSAWAEAWSNYHRDCRGWGGTTFYESHPYGSTTASEQMFDPCGQTADGVCCRCGEDGLLHETGEGPCANCGWNYDDGEPEEPRGEPDDL